MEYTHHASSMASNNWAGLKQSEPDTVQSDWAGEAFNKDNASKKFFSIEKMCFAISSLQLDCKLRGLNQQGDEKREELTLKPRVLHGRPV